MANERFDLWVEMLHTQDAVMVKLVLIALTGFLVVHNARRWGKTRQATLWAMAVLFWVSMVGLVFLKGLSYTRVGSVFTSGLWYDETFTHAVSRLPFERMMTAIRGDVHPPLWYIIEHGWIALTGGRPEFVLRFPALLFGGLSVYLTYRLALALGYDRKVATFSALALALTPGQIYYAQEARMYTLLQTAVLVAALGLVTARPWLMGLGMVAALYTHNLAPAYVGVIGLLALWLALRGDTTRDDHPRPRTPLVTTLAVGGLVLAAWAPWLRVALRQAVDVRDGFWLQQRTLGGYLMPLYQLTFGVGAPSWTAAHGALAGLGVLIVALWGLWDRFRERRSVVLLALAFGPALVLALITLVWRPVYLQRALLPSLPALVILFAVGFQRLHLRYRKPVLAVLIPLVLLVLPLQTKGVDYRAWTDDIAKRYRPGDVVWHGNLASYITFGYYLPDPPYASVCWPDAGDLSQALTVETQRALGVDRAEADEVEASRLWVVWIENPTSTPEERKAASRALDLGHAERVMSWEDSELVTAELWVVDRDKGAWWKQGKHRAPKEER